MYKFKTGGIVKEVRSTGSVLGDRRLKKPRALRLDPRSAVAIATILPAMSRKTKKKRGF